MEILRVYPHTHTHADVLCPRTGSLERLRAATAIEAFANLMAASSPPTKFNYLQKQEHSHMYICIATLQPEIFPVRHFWSTFDLVRAHEDGEHTRYFQETRNPIPPHRIPHLVVIYVYIAA